MMPELIRRLYVELFHVNQQLTSIPDEEGEPVYFTGSTVRDVLADAKAFLEAPSGWQPIETAPKERGGLVDIICNERRYAGCHYDRICDEYRHITACGVLIRLKGATHWMAIPAAPGVQAPATGSAP